MEGNPERRHAGRAGRGGSAEPAEAGPDDMTSSSTGVIGVGVSLTPSMGRAGPSSVQIPGLGKAGPDSTVTSSSD